jgi:hypothetical protein
MAIEVNININKYLTQAPIEKAFNWICCFI